MTTGRGEERAADEARASACFCGGSETEGCRRAASAASDAGG